uniref:valine--tRNA ligase n=1 Tax=Gongylonema pulchrum TaxID=637853 RepID=A0A183CUH1_9BILA
LKITPSHDHVDFAIARKYIGQLLSDEDVSRRCINDSGCLVNASDFNGLDRFEARIKIISRLCDNGKYGGTMPFPEQQLKICGRTGDLIEPVLKKQWFVDCVAMNDTALAALEEGTITVLPRSMQIHLENWLNRKEPWCISRQLDWGQRIPAFRPHSSDRYVRLFSRGESVNLGFGFPGWPDRRINRVPLSVLETGFDIAGFWVARMLTVCHSLTGFFPFTKVLLHGLVRDDEGKKMSKSLGNVIDPLDIIDGVSSQTMLQRLDENAFQGVEKRKAAISLKARFPEGIRRCGPDALRFALLRHDASATDINIDIVQEASEGLRFCNKLWNLCNYAGDVWDNVEGEVVEAASSDRIEDRWIKSRLKSTFLVLMEKMGSDRPHLAFAAMYKFLWNDLCDVYLETTKKALWAKDRERLNVVAGILHEVLEKSLVRLSIFMPFVSEYLFDRIKRKKERNLYDLCLTEKTMDAFTIDNELEKEMHSVLEIIKTVRSLRVLFQLSRRDTLQVACQPDAFDLKRFQHVIQDLCNVTLLSTVPKISSCGRFVPFPVHGYSTKIFVALEVAFADGCLMPCVRGDYEAQIKEKLNNQLQSAQSRKDQFLCRIKKHEMLAKNCERKDLLDKHERRITQVFQKILPL